jgi:hypothetical protein
MSPIGDMALCRITLPQSRRPIEAAPRKRVGERLAELFVIVDEQQID